MSDSDRQTQMLYGFNYMQSMRMLFTQGLYYDVELIIRDKRFGKFHSFYIYININNWQVNYFFQY